MQKYAHLNRDVKNGALHIPIKKKWVSLYSFLGKKGLIVYLAALKKGAIRAAHPYHVIYRELPPPPPPPHPEVFIFQVERVLEVELNKDNLLHFFHHLTTRLSQHSDVGYEIRIHGLPVLLLERIGFKMVLNSDV